MRSAVAFAAVAAVLAGSSSAQLNAVTRPSTTSQSIVPNTATLASIPSPTASGEPCAIVSSIVASLRSANPESTDTPFVPPSKALACLEAVPLDVAKSVAFIDYLRPFLQLQSSLAYLKNPPKGYTLPGVDIIGGFDQIKQNLQNGLYKTQWGFEKDVNALVNIMPRDFHVVLPLPLNNVFSFTRGLHLVSISSDGLKIPQIYVKSDVDQFYSPVMNGTLPQWRPSPIVSIDDQPVSQYLQTVSLFGNYEDPDTLFNQLFYSPALAFQKGGDSFYDGYNKFGLNDTTSYIFANDTEKPKVVANAAYVQQNFTDIDSGAALFSKAVLPPEPTTTSATPTESSAPTTTSTPPPLQTVTGYPSNPIALHPEFYTAGFFLEGSDDICVLAISSFAGKLPNSQQLMQQTIRETISNCTHAGKTKLIIDVSANGGGAIFNGYDAFKQLFPSIQPFGGSRLRSTPGVQFLIDVFSQSGIYDAVNNTVYQTQSNLDVDLKPFATPQDMYGPFQYAGDNFTAELRWNLSDTISTLGTGDGIVVSGYGALSNLPAQPFAAENIIFLTDGSCGSTCTIFAELMKTQGGVRSITVGGRPQYGPMQYVAGSKGSQVYSYKTIQGIANFIPLINQSFVAQGKPFPALPAPEWIPSLEAPPLGPALTDEVPNFNLRNAYKPNDASQTPTQFIYEPANCRLFFTAADLYDVTALWRRVARVTWGNGTCVQGSTTTTDGRLPRYANETVPFSQSAVSNATNPFTGPGSLGYGAPGGDPSASSTAATPSASSTGPAQVPTSGDIRSFQSSSLLFVVVLAALFSYLL